METQDTCFVIMPIGIQKFGNVEYTKEDLKRKFDDLIKEAILKAKPNLTILRADDVSLPGSISNDIFTRLMYSRFVIADISIPNPNVFYELGIRHAIRSGTILIKDKDIENSVFDISHLRYIEYENTPTGLKNLAQELNQTFEWIEKNPKTIDNQFLELASLTMFKFPEFINLEEVRRKKNQALISFITFFFKKPEFSAIFMNQSLTPEEKNSKIAELLIKDPESISEILNHLNTAGLFQYLL